MIAPQLYYSAASLWDTIPEKVNQLVDWATEKFGENEVLLRYFDLSYEAIYGALDNWADTTLVPQVTSIVTGVGSSIWSVLVFFKNLLIGLIVAV